MLHFLMGGRDIWLFLFSLGVLLFNWPFLRMFREHLPYYLFAVWAVFILLAGVIAALGRKDREP